MVVGCGDCVLGAAGGCSVVCCVGGRSGCGCPGDCGVGTAAGCGRDGVGLLVMTVVLGFTATMKLE